MIGRSFIHHHIRLIALDKMQGCLQR